MFLMIENVLMQLLKNNTPHIRLKTIETNYAKK